MITQAHRELASATQQRVFTSTVVRVHAPDRTVLSATFSPLVSRGSSLALSISRHAVPPCISRRRCRRSPCLPSTTGWRRCSGGARHSSSCTLRPRRPLSCALRAPRSKKRVSCLRSCSTSAGACRRRSALWSLPAGSPQQISSLMRHWLLLRRLRQGRWPPLLERLSICEHSGKDSWGRLLLGLH